MATYTYDTEKLNNISPADMEAAGLLTKSARGERKPNHGYNCVYCSSGTGKNQSGALNFDFKGDHWAHFCQACGNGGDNLKFFQHVFNADFQSACKQASDMFGVPYTETSSNTTFTPKKRPPLVDDGYKFPPSMFRVPDKTAPEQVPLIKADIADAQKFLDKLPDDQRRGLWLETLQYFGCGFAPQWTHPVTRLSGKTVYKPLPRIIIPSADGEHYNAVALDRDRQLNRDNPDFKPKMHAGAKTQLFNEADIHRFETVMFVEGEIDAMSIWQAVCICNKPNKPVDPELQQFGIVATYGTAGWKSLFLSKFDAGLFPWRKIIILFDKDAESEAGQSAANNFKAALNERNIPAYVAFIDDLLLPDEEERLGNKVDANKYLTTVGNYSLREIITRIVADAEREFGDIHPQTSLDIDSPKKSPPESLTKSIAGADEHKQLSCAYTSVKIEKTSPPKKNADNSLTESIDTPDEHKQLSCAYTSVKIEKTSTVPKNEFADKISDWEVVGGVIDPTVVDELESAHEMLTGCNADNLTLDIANASKTKRAVALCQFYDCFIADANKFITLLKKRRGDAHATIQTSKHMGTTADDTDFAWEDFSISEFKRGVDDFVKQIKKAHKHFGREYAKQRAIEDGINRRIAHDKHLSDALIKLGVLRKQAPSPERDEQIIQILNDNADWKTTPQGDRIAVKATAANADLIFTNDPVLDGLIGYDQFFETYALLKPVPWRDSKRGDEWRDADNAELQVYLRRTYTEFADEKLIKNYTISYGNKHAFHPIKEMFANLPAWDGTHRAATLFIDFLKVPDTPYAREVTTKWLLAAVARIFNPGCTYQNVLVLQGNQQIGKSYILERLFGRWHNTMFTNVNDFHAIDALRNTWCGEFKEMAGLRNVEINAIKSFIERCSDNYRSSYDKLARPYLRHCVFAITANDNNFLVDKTGNRRYHILESPLPMFGFVEGFTDEYIKQIWAEVLAMYNELFADGFDAAKLDIDLETKKTMESIAERYVRDDGLENEIQGYLNMPIPPAVVWLEMTKEERRRFIAEGQIIFELDTLSARRRARGGKQSDIEISINELYVLTHSNNHSVKSFTTGDNRTFYKFFGSEFREHICASEVFNECWNTDKRKSMIAIHETLAKLEGWHEGERLRNRDPHYPDQKKVYYRDAEPDEIIIERINMHDYGWDDVEPAFYV